MRNLNEFSTAYPSSIGNSQSQEYNGALGPVDAETVQGKDRLNPDTNEGLHRINVFIANAFRRVTLNPQYEVVQLKARLNHLNLDFPFNASTPLAAVNDYIVTRGGSAFGVTPTTDLSKGFDTGQDLQKYNLQIRVIKVDGGFKLEGKMGAGDTLTENLLSADRRSQRINTIKKVMEGRESTKAENIVDPHGDTQKEGSKFKNSTERKLKSVKGKRR